MDNKRELDNTEIFKLFFESSLDAAFISDLSGEIHEVNSAAVKLLGFTKEEFCQLGRSGIIYSTGTNLEILLSDKKHNGKLPDEVKLRRKNGNFLPAEISSQFFHLKNGETRICLVARDTTDRKISELLFKEAADFNRKILKSAPIGIATYNTHGNCIYVNDYFAKIMGVSRNHLLAQNFRKDSSWKEYGLCGLAEKALSEGVEINKEINIITAFGINLLLDLTFTTFHSYGEPNLLLMIDDISERKKAEELLRKSEEKFRTSVETMLTPFGLCEAVRDSENNIIDFVFRYLNKAGSDLMKIQAGMKLRENSTKFFPLQNQTELFNNFCQIIETALPFNKKIIIYDETTGNDIKYVLDLSAVKLDDGLAFSCSDITEIKMIEQKLKVLNENKDKLFSIIAHDLKSPFHSFLDITEVLSEDSGYLTPEKQKEFFQMSYQSVSNIFKLLENLLQWANNQSGGINYNPEKFFLQDLANSLLCVFRTVARQKNISIEMINNISQPVYADKNMIETALRNLISNAVKFTPENGTINIEINPDGADAKISVCDNGVGINEKNAERMFKLGEKISTLGTNKERGTGLGLILCKEFIEKNKGNLFFKSKQGQGSVFSFTIPFA